MNNRFKEANSMQKVTPNPERTIRSGCASMIMEGFHVLKQTQEDCRAVLSDQKSVDDLIALYLSNCSQAFQGDLRR